MLLNVNDELRVLREKTELVEQRDIERTVT
jgi:hypothetical protein